MHWKWHEFPNEMVMGCLNSKRKESFLGTVGALYVAFVQKMGKGKRHSWLLCGAGLVWQEKSSKWEWSSRRLFNKAMTNQQAQLKKNPRWENGQMRQRMLSRHLSVYLSWGIPRRWRISSMLAKETAILSYSLLLFGDRQTLFNVWCQACPSSICP